MGPWTTDITPEPKVEKKNGFFLWLQENYGEVASAGRDIACIVNPRTCGNMAGGETVVVQDDSSKTYFLLLGAILITILLVVLVKK